ncbi:MAG: carboxymuconolactone decarboxylase family protein [Ilumatobacteraceae bacterium]
MTQRLDAAKVAPELYRTISALEQHVHANIDPTLDELIKLRSSMINGCTFCIDMHSADALKAGETTARLFGLGAWHEAPFYTAKERAALALTDEVTRLGPNGVSDEVWNGVRAEFEEREVAYLVARIGVINLWNRLAIAFQSTPLSAARA